MQKFIYTEDTKELLDTVGISEKEFWDFMRMVASKVKNVQHK